MSYLPALCLHQILPKKVVGLFTAIWQRSWQSRIYAVATALVKRHSCEIANDVCSAPARAQSAAAWVHPTSFPPLTQHVTQVHSYLNTCCCAALDSSWCSMFRAMPCLRCDSSTHSICTTSQPTDRYLSTPTALRTEVRIADWQCAAQLARDSPVDPGNQLTLRVKSLHMERLLRRLLYT